MKRRFSRLFKLSGFFLSCTVGAKRFRYRVPPHGPRYRVRSKKIFVRDTVHSWAVGYVFIPHRGSLSGITGAWFKGILACFVIPILWVVEILIVATFIETPEIFLGDVPGLGLYSGIMLVVLTYTRRRCTVWKLTKSGWEREAENLGRRGERHRKWPKEESLKHFLEVNDFYVGIAPELDETFGGYPNWEWRDEPKSYTTYPLPAKKKGYHRPDAEIHVGDLTFFIERQSERSRKTQETFDNKCANYRRYIEYTERDRQKNHAVFICDTERDAQYAHKAATENELAHIWGGVEETIDAVLEIAKDANIKDVG